MTGKETLAAVAVVARNESEGRSTRPPVTFLSAPFKLPAWRGEHFRKKIAAQNKLVASVVGAMEVEVLSGIDYIFYFYERMQEYRTPSFNRLYAATEKFYRDVVTAAFHSAQGEKKDLEPVKRLAKAVPKLPRNFDRLDKLFKNRRYWSSILNRSERLTTSLRRQYLMRLRKQFDKLLPEITSGEISVDQAKKAMKEAWNASKPRVETIFRTETTNYFAKTSVAMFEDDDEIIGFLFDSVGDAARTQICKSRHGLIYRPGSRLLRENTPSCHFNCRSHLVALANNSFNRRLLNEPSRDPAKRSVVPLPRGWRKAA